MLLVFLLLQLMPPDANNAVAGAMGSRHSWQTVQTRVEREWEISLTLPDTSRPENSHLAAGWDATDSPIVDARCFTLNHRLVSAMPTGQAVGSAIPNPAIGGDGGLQSGSQSSSTSTAASDDVSPARDSVAVVSGGLSSSANLLARLMSTADARVQNPNAGGNTGGPGTLPPPPSNPNGPGGIGNPNGPGGGVGTSIPEPAAIPLLALALPLMLRRRRPVRNHAQ